MTPRPTTELPVTAPPKGARPRGVRPSIAEWLMAAVVPRAYRLGVLAAAAWVLYVAAQRPAPPDSIALDDAQLFFTDAASLAAGDARLGGQTVLDPQGKLVGLLLTTSP